MAQVGIRNACILFPAPIPDSWNDLARVMALCFVQEEEISEVAKLLFFQGMRDFNSKGGGTLLILMSLSLVLLILINKTKQQLD